MRVCVVCVRVCAMYVHVCVVTAANSAFVVLCFDAHQLRYWYHKYRTCEWRRVCVCVCVCVCVTAGQARRCIRVHSIREA